MHKDQIIREKSKGVPWVLPAPVSFLSSIAFFYYSGYSRSGAVCALAIGIESTKQSVLFSL